MKGEYKKRTKKTKNSTGDVLVLIFGFVVAITVTVVGWYIRAPYTYGQTDAGFAIRQYADSQMPMTLSYVSPNGKKVVESYEVADNRMSFNLLSIKYEKGADHIPDTEGGTTQEKDGWVYIDSINQPISEFVFKDPASRSCTVDYDGHVYDLAEIMPKGKNIYFYVAPFYKSWFQKKEMPQS